MNDLPVILWPLLSLAGGTLIVRAGTSSGRFKTTPVVCGILLLIAGVFGGLSIGRATGPALVSLLTSVVTLVLAHRLRRSVSEQDRSGALLLIGVITAGLGFGAFIVPDEGLPGSGPSPVLLLDPQTEKAEIRTELELAIIDLKMILERDLPARELDARSDQQWQRIETLSKIRSRIGLELGALEATMNSLDDPEVAPPDPILLRKRLESLERLVGAIRVER